MIVTFCLPRPLTPYMDTGLYLSEESFARLPRPGQRALAVWRGRDSETLGTSLK